MATTTAGEAMFMYLVEIDSASLASLKRAFGANTQELLLGLQGIDEGLGASRLRRAEVASVEKGQIGTHLIEAAASLLGRPTDDLRASLGSNWLSKIPTVECWVDMIARRRANATQGVRASDGMDLCHFLALPYCRMALLERNAASLVRLTAKRYGAEVFATPGELGEALTRLTAEGSSRR
jgi:hypothetical protein